LCLWEVNKFRYRLWRSIEPVLGELPAAFLTLVPPMHRVCFNALPQVSIANYMRPLRRLLNRRLPVGTILIGVFDVSLVDDQRSGRCERHWLPHFHILVVGILVVGVDAAEARQVCDGLYTAAELVPRPSHVRDAPSPRGALAYCSLKHVGDIKARAG
jgi:hypothetical protein